MRDDKPLDRRGDELATLYRPIAQSVQARLLRQPRLRQSGFLFRAQHAQKFSSSSHDAAMMRETAHAVNFSLCGTAQC